MAVYRDPESLYDYNDDEDGDDGNRGGDDVAEC